MLYKKTDLQKEMDEARCRIEGREFGVTLPRLLGGNVTRPRLTAVIITKQQLWGFQQKALMKKFEKYLNERKRLCQKELGWRKIHTNYIFRTEDVDLTQPRDEYYWHVI